MCVTDVRAWTCYRKPCYIGNIMNLRTSLEQRPTLTPPSCPSLPLLPSPLLPFRPNHLFSIFFFFFLMAYFSSLFFSFPYLYYLPSRLFPSLCWLIFLPFPFLYFLTLFPSHYSPHFLSLFSTPIITSPYRPSFPLHSFPTPFFLTQTCIKLCTPSP